MKMPFQPGAGKPECISRVQKEALTRMQHVVETRSLGVLTGEVGSGKTTLLRALTASLPATDYQVVYLSSAGLPPRDLYGGILRALGETPVFSLGKLKHQWQEIMNARLLNTARQILLLIDEAHDLPEKTLLELRFLMCRGMDPEAPFPIILAGQAKLRLDLRKSIYESIAQRIRMQYHLQGMTAEECAAYIEQQMQEAELTRPVFSDSAIQLIHASSHGIPRVVNLLCAHALFASNQRKDNAIEEKHVMMVLADLERQRGGDASWSANTA